MIFHKGLAVHLPETLVVVDPGVNQGSLIALLPPKTIQGALLFFAVFGGHGFTLSATKITTEIDVPENSL